MIFHKAIYLCPAAIINTFMLLTAESAAAAGLGGRLNATSSLIAAIAKIIGSLAVVLTLMLLLLYIIKKLGLGKGGITKSGSQIKIIETRMVAPKKYIVIAQIAGKVLALGVTENSINMLTDLENHPVSPISEPGGEFSAPSFSGALQKAASFVKKSQSLGRETKL